MASSGMIHWHEGMFLQPHHLQAAVRELKRLIRDERGQRSPHAYGVIEAEPRIEELEKFTVAFDRLRVIMPSGVEINVPENADLPSRNFRRELLDGSGSLMISLGVPMWQVSRGNTIELGSDRAGEAARLKRLYKLVEAELADENTGDNPQRVILRRFNARLVLPGDDTSDLDLLPLVRLEVDSGRGEEQLAAKEDSSFVPPVMTLGAAPQLRQIIRDLAIEVGTNRVKHVEKLAGPTAGWNAANVQPSSMATWLRLSSLNRWYGVLRDMAEQRALHPMDVCFALKQFYGELVALCPDRDPSLSAEKDAFDSPMYDHDNLGPVFRELEKKIKPLLRESGKGKMVKVNFKLEGRAIVSEEIPDEALKQGLDFHLGIRTSKDVRSLQAFVEDRARFKLMPFSLRASRLNIPGVKTEIDFGPPYELPRQSGQSYFRLLKNQSEDRWAEITRDRRIAILRDETEKFEFQEIALFIVVP